MYRRIEFLFDPTFGKVTYRGIFGIMGCGIIDVIEAWIDIPKAPKYLNKNCKFFWTEVGWNKYGRKVIIECKKHNVRFRIINIKEKSCDIFYKDKDQVAVRNRTKRNKINLDNIREGIEMVCELSNN